MNSGSSGEKRAPEVRKVDTLIPLELCQKAPNREVSMSTESVVSRVSHSRLKYSRTEYRNGQVIFTIYQEPQTYRLFRLWLDSGQSLGAKSIAA